MTISPSLVTRMNIYGRWISGRVVDQLCPLFEEVKFVDLFHVCEGSAAESVRYIGLEPGYVGSFLFSETEASEWK